MRVGILGSGLMGAKLGTIFARAGHDVVFSYARSQARLKKLARDAGAKERAGTPREAAKDADVILLAVHWSRFHDVLKQAGDLSGKVMVTCSLPMDPTTRNLSSAPPRRGRKSWRRWFRRLMLFALSILCRVRCSSVCSRRRARIAAPAWFTAEMIRGAKVETDSRCGVRPGGCWAAADRALHRAVRAAHRPACIRGRGRTRIGVPLRAVWRVTPRHVRARQVGQLLCNRRIGCGRADRIAVCRAHADCREAARRCGGRGSRVWQPDDRSFRISSVFVGTAARALANDHVRRGSLGSFGLRRGRVLGDRLPANAEASRVPTGI
jgi:F420-dependent NADP oxidoreductase-like protein